MSWFSKMIGVDKVIDRKVNELLKGVVIPNAVVNPQLLNYRAREYKVWASSNADNLLTFYKGEAEPTIYADRLLFWKWVGGINVPKFHYPAPEILLNYIKGILFSGEVEIEASKDNAIEEVSVLNERIKDSMDDIGFDDFTHNGSLYETYSGSLAVRVVIDPDVHDKPILQLYPRERFEIVEKYGKVLEYIFYDEYWKGDKVYVLKSYYGKGYVDYKLFHKNKEVPLNTIPDTADLQMFEFGGNLILSTWKKNRTVSNEFSELIYGGSDFEGITDMFHSIDEVFSSLMLTIRRNRPMMGVDESLLPIKENGSATYIPKEYEFDMMKFRNNESNQNKIWRDNPELKTKSHMDSISQLMLSIYQKVGMSYATVNDSGIGANASGEAITKREKSTTIMRDSKIKLWIPFLKDVIRLYLIVEDYMETKMIADLNVDKYKDFDFSVTFPDYNGQSFAERVKELGDAKDFGLIDTATAIDKLYGKEYTEDERLEITRNTKLEKGEVLLPNQVVGIE